MALWHHPDWPDYKAALERLADASSYVEAVRQAGSPQLGEAERRYSEALAAYEALHQRIHGPALRGAEQQA